MSWFPFHHSESGADDEMNISKTAPRSDLKSLKGLKGRPRPNKGKFMVQVTVEWMNSRIVKNRDFK
jgi:hypothetical protein